MGILPVFTCVPLLGKGGSNDNKGEIGIETRCVQKLDLNSLFNLHSPSEERHGPGPCAHGCQKLRWPAYHLNQPDLHKAAQAAGMTLPGAAV